MLLRTNERTNEQTTELNMSQMAYFTSGMCERGSEGANQEFEDEALIFFSAQRITLDAGTCDKYRPCRTVGLH
jgi:hypothetical protein